MYSKQAFDYTNELLIEQWKVGKSATNTFWENKSKADDCHVVYKKADCITTRSLRNQVRSTGL